MAKAKPKRKVARPTPALAAPEPQGKILSLDQAVPLVGGHVTRHMLRKEISRGRLKAMHIGPRRIATTVAWIDEWLAGRAKESAVT